jgi:Fe-S-cluster-containing dehydrogenase component
MHNVILTDLNRCVGCLSCSVACKSANGVPVGSFWNKVLRIGPNPKKEGDQCPNSEMYFLPLGCQHCYNPECVKVCPTQASYVAEDGTIQVDKAKCIGCQFCVMACPYGVRYLNEDERVVEKCTLCEQKTAQGYLPQCVEQCCARARFFGDIDKGIDNLEAPGEPTMFGDDKSYETMKKTRIKYSEVCDKNDKPYTDADIHQVPNVGNNPSFVYVLRNRTWRGGE